MKGVKALEALTVTHPGSRPKAAMQHGFPFNPIAPQNPNFCHLVNSTWI